MLFLNYICQYCGKEKDWNDRDYDMGLYLAERESFERLGHEEDVSPYLICKDCANKTKEREGNV